MPRPTSEFMKSTHLEIVFWKKNEKGSGPESLTFAAYVWGPALIFSEIKDGRSLLS